MGLIKEPKNIDLMVNSKPWTPTELADFRKLMCKASLNKPKSDLKIHSSPPQD